MGRYYETAKPTFVDDVIYQAPYELIARALESKDLQVEEDEAEIDEVGILSDDKKYTEQDKEKRNQVVNGYRTEIDNIAKKIQENPEHRNYYMRKIDTARKKFDKDISTGFLNDADQNFTLREAARKQILDRTDITEKQKTTTLNQLDFKFKGSDSEEEGGNRYSENLHIYEAIDEEKFIKDKKAVLRANAITTNKNRTDGRYFTDESGVRKFIDNDRLDKTFESSTGVAKWEKALLQRLNMELDQGIIKTTDERDEIFRADRAKFKEDTINSLGFDETTTTDKKSVDGTNRADAANRRAEEKHKKDMETLASEGAVVIDRDIIPVPQENQTIEDKKAAKYNQAGKNLKDKITARLKASGNYTTQPPESGPGPQEAPYEDTETLNKDMEKEYNEILNILKLPVEQRREATAKLKKEGNYKKGEITDLLNFAHNKEELYNREKLTPTEVKTFKTGTYKVIPPTYSGQVTYPDGKVVNMTKVEFEKAAAKVKVVKKKTDENITIVIKNKTYAAYIDKGKKYPIANKKIKGADGIYTGGEKVLLSKYDANTSYQGDNKIGTEKVETVEGVPQPFISENMSVSTTDKVMFESSTQEGVPSSYINVHYNKMIFRINSADIKK